VNERTATSAIGGDDRVLARHALENVCSTADPGRATGVYSRDFLDHVNARDYSGHAGIRSVRRAPCARPRLLLLSS
jgi:hypothetical protein